MPYLLTFYRFVIGLIFTYSFLAKLREGDHFTKTITDFKLLPGRLSKPVAVSVLTGELATVVMIIRGGQLLPLAFSLATFLLLVFTTALVFVLSRKIQVPCNCFGANEQPVTAYDLWRNAGFIFCAAGGWLISQAGDGRPLAWAEWGVIAVLALVFVVLLTHLGEITALFRPAWEK